MASEPDRPSVPLEFHEGITVGRDLWTIRVAGLLIEVASQHPMGGCFARFSFRDQRFAIVGPSHPGSPSMTERARSLEWTEQELLRMATMVRRARQSIDQRHGERPDE